MIRVTSTGLNVSVSGPVVYLDNWAFIELAKKDPSRRRRFIDAVHSGVDLLFDELLKNKMSVVRDRCKRDPALFDQKFPLISFNPARPACFVYFNLLRAMAVEANSLKKGDGMDFCHAVVACAFSSFAALDTQWKRRVASLPPNRLARIYSPLELDQMVADMELWLRHRAA
jgi:hypothetical protein